MPDELEFFIQQCIGEQKQQDRQSTNLELYNFQSPWPYDTVTFEDVLNNPDIINWMKNGEQFQVIDQDIDYNMKIPSEKKLIGPVKSVIPKHFLKPSVVISKPKIVSHNNAKLMEFFETYNKNDSSY